MVSIDEHTHTHTKRFASLQCRLQFYFPLHELHISYCLCVIWLWFWRATTRYETCAPTQIHGINITKNNSNNNKFHRDISIQPDSSSLSKVKCVCVFIKFNVLPHTCEKAPRRKKCWYKIPQRKADEKEKEIWRSFYSIMGSLPFFSFFYFIVRSEKPEIFNREKLNAATTKNDAQSIRSHRKSDKKKHVGTMSGEKS